MYIEIVNQLFNSIAYIRTDDGIAVKATILPKDDSVVEVIEELAKPYGNNLSVKFRILSDEDFNYED